MEFMNETGLVTGYVVDGAIRLADWMWFHLANWILNVTGWNFLDTPPLAPVSLVREVQSAEKSTPLRLYLFYHDIAGKVQPSVDKTLGYLNSLITQMLVFGHDAKQVAPTAAASSGEVSKGRDEVIQSIIADARRASSEFRTVSKKLVDEYETKFAPVSSQVSRLEDQKLSHQNILQECAVRQSRLQQLVTDLEDPAMADRPVARSQIDQLLVETEQQTRAAQFNLSQINEDIKSQSGENQRIADERAKIKQLDLFLTRFATYIQVMEAINTRHLKPSSIAYVMGRLVEFVESDPADHLSDLATKEVLHAFAANANRFKHNLKTNKAAESDIDQVTQAIADELITSEMARNC